MLEGLLKVLRWKNEKAEAKPINNEVEVEQKPTSRGQGNWKNKKYSLVKNKGERYRFYYRFNENEALEYICGAYKSDEKELVKHIENCYEPPLNILYNVFPDKEIKSSDPSKE